MPSGALRVDLASGEVRVASSEHDPPPPPAFANRLILIFAPGARQVAVRLLQERQLASVSWSLEHAGRLFMGSPWDDGVLVCPAV